jgi:hypothetical protein
MMVRNLVGTALIALPLMAQQFHIDHVTVAGRNVEAMQKALREAGIRSEYGGPHSNHATEMALASFPDGSYLELIAIQPKADPAALAAHEWHKFLESDGGPCAWAIRPANVSAEVQRLRAAGVAVTDPSRSGRKRPDGFQLDWETSQIGPTRGGFFPFMIHDFTPHDNRAFSNGKPTTTGWTGVVKVVIGVRDLDSAIARYQRAYDLPAPERQDDELMAVKLAWFRNTPIVLASPIHSGVLLDTRLRGLGEAPYAFILGAHEDFSPLLLSSKWFGSRVFWADYKQLGWDLGFQQQ